MQLDEYQELARTTAIYPASHSKTYPILGLVGEFAELDAATLMHGNNVLKEAGCVWWYIANTAVDFDLKLSDVFACQMPHAVNRWLGHVCSLDALGGLAETAKKLIRDGQVSEQRIADVPKHLKKLGEMVAAILQSHGYTLNECLKANIKKLFDRKERGVLGGDGDNR